MVKRILLWLILVATIICLLIIVLTAHWINPVTQQPYHVIPPVQLPVCVDGHKSTTLPEPAGLSDPNNGALAWTCDGRLVQWDSSVPAQPGHAYPGKFLPSPLKGQPWCRIASAQQSGVVEYHRLATSGSCANGPLVFVTRPDDPPETLYSRNDPNWIITHTGLCYAIFQEADCDTAK